MRIGLLSSLTIALAATLSSQAQASGDDSCYPNWSLTRNDLQGCSNLVFLNPGNDSRINLRLLLADQGSMPLVPRPLSEEENSEGFGPVPFPLSRLSAAVPASQDSEQSEPAAQSPDSARLDGLLEQLQVSRETPKAAGDDFLSGEGSRCRSNSDASASAFIEQLLKADLSQAERQALARGRVQLLGACTWDVTQQAAALPQDIQSAAGKDFVLYLQSAADFYSGRFNEAASGFASLSKSSAPWLQETAVYMLARNALNQAQRDAFDEYGSLLRDKLDKQAIAQAESTFEQYLSTYPQGLYQVSARGLLRRAHWLAGNTDRLAADYAWQLSQGDDEQRNMSRDDLVEEVDTKLLMDAALPTQGPLLMAVKDLMGMRNPDQPSLTRDTLQRQQGAFAEQPALYEYLQAAFAFYLEHNPDGALQKLPATLPGQLDYLSFSQQFLRGLALHAKADWKTAENLWLQLLPLARQPLQREQLELALAMNYERSGQLAKVFAGDSPIKSQQVRYILQRQVADAALLRQQLSQAGDPLERQAAQFVLLYKDLMRGQYGDFGEDFKQLPAPLPDTKLGNALGYNWDQGPSLQLFQWNGASAESGYRCPGLAETAALLQQDGKSPQGLNCLGEFILRNHLDGMPLDRRPQADELGGSAPHFKGPLYSRLDGYQRVIDNPKASRDDRAYALYRAINCFASSGYNGCGGKGVEPEVRKAWFRQLKTRLGDTQWAQTLKYYW